MPRKTVFICCLALTHASTLHNDYPPATAVSYSSISFGSPIIEHKSTIGSIDLVPTYDWLSNEEIKNVQPQGNFRDHFTNNFEVNAYAAPLDTKSMIPQYVKSFEQNNPKAATFDQMKIKYLPTSKNIPLQPSPEFATAPSILKTEGLSAYASVPLETSAPSASEKPKNVSFESNSSKTSKLTTSSKDSKTKSYSEPSVSEFYSAAKTSSEDSATSGFLSEAQPIKVTYSGSPAVSYVSISNSENSYYW